MPMMAIGSWGLKRRDRGVWAKSPGRSDRGGAQVVSTAEISAPGDCFPGTSTSPKGDTRESVGFGVGSGVGWGAGSGGSAAWFDRKYGVRAATVGFSNSRAELKTRSEGCF